MSGATVFADLCAELDALPEVSIVAVGGLPIVLHDGVHCLFNQPVTAERVREELRRGLGLGAVLTFQNPNGKSLDALGEMCVKQGHLWTEHVLSLTIAFARSTIAVRNAFAFDRRFHLSWVEREVQTDPCTFTATGSVRDWKRVTGYVDQPSFQAEPRQWFGKVKALIEPVLP